MKKSNRFLNEIQRLKLLQQEQEKSEIKQIKELLGNFDKCILSTQGNKLTMSFRTKDYEEYE